MFGPKISIDKALYKRAQKRAADLGYSDVKEYLIHLLEKDLGGAVNEGDEAAVEERLKGLGYL